MHNFQFILPSFSKFLTYTKDDLKYLISVGVSVTLLLFVSVFLLPTVSKNIGREITSIGVELLSLVIGLAEYIIYVSIILRASSWISNNHENTKLFLNSISLCLFSILVVALCAGLIYLTIPIIVFFTVTAGMSPSGKTRSLSEFMLHFSLVMSFFYVFSGPVLLFNGKKGFKNVIMSLLVSIREPIIAATFTIPVYILNLIRFYLIPPGILQGVLLLAGTIISYTLSILALFVYALFINGNIHIRELHSNSNLDLNKEDK